MSIQITNRSELENSFIIWGTDTNVILSKRRDLDWGKQGFILVVLVRLAVFFSYYFITSSSAAEAIKLINIDTPSYALQKKSTLILE